MGERFGNYELLEKIAVGGMAEIFLARASHGRGVARNIVIKRIHPALSADENFVGMFIDEARLGVTMMHGNIVPVFDFGCVDGYYYLAMEHVAGRDLSALLGRARVVGVPWPVDIAIYIVLEVLEGLDYAHRKRDDQGRPIELVHRDVSPSNILISHDGQVKLLDFGIARSLASEYETRTGIVKGKPGYMSPEQACGAAVDARADIWSCGSVLHELLTGNKVKEGRNQTGDARIDAVLAKALAAAPTERYATARDFQEALADILVERSRRPTARDLVAVVEQIVSANAPSEDWNMHTNGADLERHLAQALAFKSKDAPASAGEARGSSPDRTLRLARPDRSRLVTFVAAGGVGLAAVLAAWAWAQTRGEATLVSARSARLEDSFAKLTPALRQQAAPTVLIFPEGVPFAVPTQPAQGREPRKNGRPAAAVERAVGVGHLSVNTEPWSHVLVDGNPAGTTPLIDFELPAGKHTLVLTNPVRNLTRTVVVTIAKGERRRIREVLGDPAE